MSKTKVEFIGIVERMALIRDKIAGMSHDDQLLAVYMVFFNFCERRDIVADDDARRDSLISYAGTIIGHDCDALPNLYQIAVEDRREANEHAN